MRIEMSIFYIVKPKSEVPKFKVPSQDQRDLG